MGTLEGDVVSYYDNLSENEKRKHDEEERQWEENIQRQREAYYAKLEEQRKARMLAKREREFQKRALKDRDSAMAAMDVYANVPFKELIKRRSQQKRGDLKMALKQREQVDFDNRLAGAISERDRRRYATGADPRMGWHRDTPEGKKFIDPPRKPINYPLPQAPQEKPYYSPLGVDPASDLFHRKVGPVDGIRPWVEEMRGYMNRGGGAQQSGHTLPPNYQDYLQYLYKLQGFGDI